jgi:hypothetical protein
MPPLPIWDEVQASGHLGSATHRASSSTSGPPRTRPAAGPRGVSIPEPAHTLRTSRGVRADGGGRIRIASPMRSESVPDAIGNPSPAGARRSVHPVAITPTGRNTRRRPIADPSLNGSATMSEASIRIQTPGRQHRQTRFDFSTEGHFRVRPLSGQTTTSKGHRDCEHIDTHISGSVR